MPPVMGWVWHGKTCCQHVWQEACCKVFGRGLNAFAVTNLSSLCCVATAACAVLPACACVAPSGQAGRQAGGQAGSCSARPLARPPACLPALCAQHAMRSKLELRAATGAMLPAAGSFCCGTKGIHPYGWPSQSVSQSINQSAVHDSVGYPVACVHFYEAPVPQVARALWPRPRCVAGRHLHSFGCPCICQAAAGGRLGLSGHVHTITTQPNPQAYMSLTRGSAWCMARCCCCGASAAALLAPVSGHDDERQRVLQCLAGSLGWLLHRLPVCCCSCLCSC
jgi:hypothetical protein